ncbi:MAG: yidC [Chthoniobacteraceae bacterium]|nr:yidC [Chthoniobacteraceae bacterium]
MDRKGILGIVLSVFALLAFEFFYYIPATQKAQREAAEAAAAAALAAPAVPVEQAPATPAPAVASGASPEAPAVPAAPIAAPAQIDTLANSAVEYSFTNLGGGISKAKLIRHTSESQNVTLNLFGTLPIGAISEVAGEGIGTPFTAAPNAAAGEIKYERTDARGLQLTKNFILPKLAGADEKTLLREEYLLRLDVTFANRGTQPLQIPAYFVYSGSSAPIHQRDQPIYTGFNYYKDGSNKLIDVNWFGGGNFLSRRQASATYTDSTPLIRWAGVTSQYFTSLVTALVDEKASSDVLAKHQGSQVWARRFVIQDEAWKAAGFSTEGKTAAERFGIDGALGMPGFTLQPGETFAQSFNVYTGPREYGRLKALGQREDEIMNFGVASPVSKVLLTSMNWLRSKLGNYAWAIVVLTLCIKSLMWPLQNKATQSMKRMQLLQPKMTELREKYKDDPTRMNTELMKLYKDYKINPLSGCLPMLIQIPIFLGFYSMLGVAVELRNSSFLWVHDLSQPDTVAHILNFPINVLPLCMAVTMFIQMAIQPKTGDPAQQKIFMFMPLIFVYFCYNFASALALYWTVQNLFSIVQLYMTRNQSAPVLVKATPPPKKKTRS